MSPLRCVDRRRRSREIIALTTAFSAALVVGLTGCSSSDEPDVQVVPPATAAESPPLAAAPEGDIIPLDLPVTATAFDSGTESLVLLSGHELVYFSPAADAPDNVNRVTLPSAGSDLALDGQGHALIAAGDSIAQVDLSSGDVGFLPLGNDEDGGAEFTAVTAFGDGSIVAGTADGAVLTEGRSVPGLVSADVVIASGEHLAVIDRRQSMIAEVFPDRETRGFALRAGNGATNAATDGRGRVFVANTRDGELLVYSLDRLVLRQRYPVPDSPYGIAYDAGNELVWVTQTGLNEVAAYVLDTGIPVEVARYATVQQPDSVAVDSAGGYLYVSSGTGGGVQRIQLEAPDED
ncbi:hypothetical protein ONR57_07395 [Hoyosella sp. YIM 151337]|uniref:YncE family protein n=1 Tax=Hoyosella sp. YIM 151337 TaxID=2992742 RepID=UPI002235E04C|nr:hypothetical protein [Hoyosella sp. YIM 151337]MCW4353120.1 hypothetical protein [Hoyosella sp. YIM 151337]